MMTVVLKEVHTKNIDQIQKIVKEAKGIKIITVLTTKSIVVVVEKNQAGENRKKDVKVFFGFDKVKKNLHLCCDIHISKDFETRSI